MMSRKMTKAIVVSVFTAMALFLSSVTIGGPKKRQEARRLTTRSIGIGRPSIENKGPNPENDGPGGNPRIFRCEKFGRAFGIRFVRRCFWAYFSNWPVIVYTGQNTGISIYTRIIAGYGIRDTLWLDGQEWSCIPW